MTRLQINSQSHDIDVPGEMPLLWALRDVLGLIGNKFGCGMGLCGAYTVHLDGVAARSCITPVSAAVGRQITTIEGISADKIGRAVQAPWLAIGVPQCGY